MLTKYEKAHSYALINIKKQFLIHSNFVQNVVKSSLSLLVIITLQAETIFCFKHGQQVQY